MYLNNRAIALLIYAVFIGLLLNILIFLPSDRVSHGVVSIQIKDSTLISSELNAKQSIQTRTECDIIEAINIYQESSGTAISAWRRNKIIKKALNSNVPIYLIIDSINTKHPIKNI